MDFALPTGLSTLLIFFCSRLNLFLFTYWMPTVFTMIGMTPAQAIFASSLRDFGAIFVALYLGFAIDRIGPERTLALHYAAGAVFIAMIALLSVPYMILCAMAFLAGATITGSQTGANGTCGKLYPARMRASGLGWALGIGRLGAIVAPLLGGYLLALGLPPTQIFLSACVFALIAAGATAALAFRGIRWRSAGPSRLPPDAHSKAVRTCWRGIFARRRRRGVSLVLTGGPRARVYPDPFPIRHHSTQLANDHTSRKADLVPRS
jgi:MFS family permease